MTKSTKRKNPAKKTKSVLSAPYVQSRPSRTHFFDENDDNHTKFAKELNRKHELEHGDVIESISANQAGVKRWSVKKTGKTLTLTKMPTEYDDDMYHDSYGGKKNRRKTNKRRK
jgi:hypothetical protein